MDKVQVTDLGEPIASNAAEPRRDRLPVDIDVRLDRLVLLEPLLEALADRPGPARMWKRDHSRRKKYRNAGE